MATPPSINEVYGEFLSLAYYHLPTITKSIRRLLDTATASAELVNEMTCANFLTIMKTWMDVVSSININNVQLVHQWPCERQAGGVAVYKGNDFA